jgi:hypothetical protein
MHSLYKSSLHISCSSDFGLYHSTYDSHSNKIEKNFVWDKKGSPSNLNIQESRSNPELGSRHAVLEELNLEAVCLILVH